MRVYWDKEGIATDPELAAFLALEESTSTAVGRPAETKGVLGVRPSQEVCSSIECNYPPARLKECISCVDFLSLTCFT